VPHVDGRDPAVADGVTQIVDVEGGAFGRTGQAAQIRHAGRGGPHERTAGSARVVAGADDLAEIVDGERRAVLAAEGAEVGGPAAAVPVHRVGLSGTRRRVADDLTTVVDRPSVAPEEHAVGGGGALRMERDQAGQEE
jgi:hypothetical protein